MKLSFLVFVALIVGTVLAVQDEPRYRSESYRVDFTHPSGEAATFADWWFDTFPAMVPGWNAERDRARPISGPRDGMVVFIDSQQPLLIDRALGAYPPYGGVSGESILLAACDAVIALGASDCRIVDGKGGRP